MKWRTSSLCALIVAGLIATLSSSVQVAAPQTPTATNANPARAVFDKYCITCHNQRLRTAGLALDTADVTNPSANPELWERVIAKLRAGSMPPVGNPRPDGDTYRTVSV